MVANNQERCENCRYYNDYKCRKNAPVMALKPPASGMMGEVHSYSTWPYTEPQLWCGEYFAADI